MGEQWQHGPHDAVGSRGGGRGGALGDVERTCAWCGRAFGASPGPGRPAKYCRRSCRQRAYEARRHAGDLDWGDRRIVEMAHRNAALEDAVDRVKGVVEELAEELAHEGDVELAEVVARLTLAIEDG